MSAGDVFGYITMGIVWMVTGACLWISGYSYGIEDRFGPRKQ